MFGSHLKGTAISAGNVVESNDVGRQRIRSTFIHNVGSRGINERRDEEPDFECDAPIFMFSSLIFMAMFENRLKSFERNGNIPSPSPQAYQLVCVNYLER